MNKKQLVIMWIGIAAFILIGLETKTIYYWEDSEVVSYGKMVVNLLGTIFVTAGLIYTFKDKKPKDE